MKEIILNPIVLVPLGSVLVVYFFLAFQIAARKDVADFLGKAFVVFFLILLTDPGIFPLSFLKPTALAGYEKTLISAIAQIIVYAAVIVILNLWFRGCFRYIFLVFKDPWIGVLLVIALLSAFWSETPDITLKNAVLIFGVSAIAANCARIYSWREIASMTRWFCAISAIVCALLSLGVPSLAVNEKGWAGFMPFPIKLGTLMAFGIVLWYSRAIHSRRDLWLAVPIILISTVTLIFSNSAQAMITVIIMLAALWGIQFLKQFEFRQALTLAIFSLIAAMFVSLVIFINLDSILAVFGKDLTLTGRTEFWPDVVDFINKKPLTGYGVGGFWQLWRGPQSPSYSIINPDGFKPPNGHNGFLDLSLETGWTGLILFAISYFGSVVRSVRHLGQHKRSVAEFPLILVTYTLMANLTETQLWGGMYYIWFLYLITSIRLRLDEQPVPAYRRADSQTLTNVY